jgi:hypothetical protein
VYAHKNETIDVITSKTLAPIGIRIQERAARSLMATPTVLPHILCIGYISSKASEEIVVSICRYSMKNVPLAFKSQ